MFESPIQATVLPEMLPRVLDKGKNIAQDLAGMVFVSQSVDHRHPRMRGKAPDDVMLIGADHDDVHHARDDARRVFDRFAASELRVPGGKVDRRAAELVHARLERQPRAGRVLVENHCEGAVFQRPIAPVLLELMLDPARALKQILGFLAGKIVKL